MSTTTRQRLLTEWLASFPKVRLNLVADSTGDWLCWCVLRGYGTVLWRQVSPPGSQAVAIAYRAARLPLTDGKVPEHAAWMAHAVELDKLGKRLADANESEIEDLERSAKRKKSAAHSAAHSAKTVQQTLNLQHTGCSGSTLSPYGRG